MNRSAPISRRSPLKRLVFLPLCLLATGGLAQSEEEPVTVLERFVAEAESFDLYDVLPHRESASVFGTNRELEETPRSVTLVESALVDLFGIRTVNDFVSITAGSRLETRAL